VARTGEYGCGGEAPVEEVEGMDTTGNHTEEVGMGTTEECLSKRLEVEGMDMMGNHMVENTLSDLEWVQRVHEGVVMVKHRSNDGAEM
jgi:hypothetical protein